MKELGLFLETAGLREKAERAMVNDEAIHRIVEEAERHLGISEEDFNYIAEQLRDKIRRSITSDNRERLGFGYTDSKGVFRYLMHLDGEIIKGPKLCKCKGKQDG